jgi:sarcosine oxidase subunit delta
MLLVHCPHCGPRSETEFVCGGEPVARPDEDRALDDVLYARDNLKGAHVELWWHRHGCRLWFRVRRDTAGNRFLP